MFTQGHTPFFEVQFKGDVNIKGPCWFQNDRQDPTVASFMGTFQGRSSKLSVFAGLASSSKDNTVKIFLLTHCRWVSRGVQQVSDESHSKKLPCTCP